MDKDDALRLEHATLLEEFKTARENMLFDLGLARQVVTITLTAAGILAVGTPYIVQSNLPILFLVIPVIFYPLAWSQIRYQYLSNNLSRYLLTVLIPRLQRVLEECSPDKERDFRSIMSWEAYCGASDARYGRMMLPVAGANYGFNLLAVIFSMGAYFMFIFQRSQSIAPLDWLLILVNLLLFSYSVFLGFWSRFYQGTSDLSTTILSANINKHV